MNLLPFAFLALLALPAFAAEEAQPQRPFTRYELSEQDKVDIVRAEKVLNELQKMEAQFIQVADGGGTAMGTLKISRPGKMRLTYDPPSKDFIVADGDFLNIWDGELQQSSSVPLGSSLADLILQKDVKLSGDIIVSRIIRRPASIGFTLVNAKDPDEGTLTLIFEERPMQLRKWVVEDAAGRLTTVALQNVRTDVNFPGGSFTFISPKFGKPNRPGL